MYLIIDFLFFFTFIFVTTWVYRLFTCVKLKINATLTKMIEQRAQRCFSEISHAFRGKELKAYWYRIFYRTQSTERGVRSRSRCAVPNLWRVYPAGKSIRLCRRRRRCVPFYLSKTPGRRLDDVVSRRTSLQPLRSTAHSWWRLRADGYGPNTRTRRDRSLGATDGTDGRTDGRSDDCPRSRLRGK